MCQRNRIWHKLWCFVACITKHHTLVTSSCIQIVLILTIFCLKRLINTHCDISRLLVKNCHNRTAVCAKAIFSIGITNLSDSISCYLLDINICICGDLTHNHNKTSCSTCFACNTAHRILLEHCV